MSERKLSKDARRRMGEAGARNLSQWRSRARTRTQALEAEVGTFRDGLLRDAGLNPTTTRIGLIEASVTTFAAILKARHAVINSARSDVPTLTERVSWLTGNLSRLLKSLDLDRKPKPRWIGDPSVPKSEQTGEIAASNPPVSAGK